MTENSGAEFYKWKTFQKGKKGETVRV